MNEVQVEEMRMTDHQHTRGGQDLSRGSSIHLTDRRCTVAQHTEQPVWREGRALRWAGPATAQATHEGAL